MEIIEPKGMANIRGSLDAACDCMCSSGYTWTDYTDGWLFNSCGCQCDGGSANENANNNTAKNKPPQET